MKKCTCINCGKPATCKHHVVPIALGGKDISSNKVPLCDECHGIIHEVMFSNHGMSHSELIKRGMQRKKEATLKGEKYKPRHRRACSDIIGRPKITIQDVPNEFITVYTSKSFKNITELAKRFSFSRTTVYKYISLIEQN